MIEMMYSFSIDNVSHSLTTSQGTRFCSQPNSSSPTPLPFEWLQVEGSAVRKVERWAIFVVVYIFAIEKVPHSLLLGDLASAPLLLPCTSPAPSQSLCLIGNPALEARRTQFLAMPLPPWVIWRLFSAFVDDSVLVLTVDFLGGGDDGSKLDSNANWYMVLMQKSECKMQN
jgi:hypothetical protein